MPSSAPKHCPRGHPAFRTRRCPACARALDAERPAARERGYDHAFEQAARVFLQTHPVCECGAPAVLVRHVVSIRKRPDLRMDGRNWKPGCRSCNAKDAARDWQGDSSTFAADRFRTGGASRAQSSDTDEAPLDREGPHDT